MRTTHGDYIPGTRLGINPPTQLARCGGIDSCPECMEEAHAVAPMDYLREEFHDAGTDSRVYQYLCEAGATPTVANNAIAVLKMHGILFRERDIQ